jgi:cystathionine gamma-synthase
MENLKEITKTQKTTKTADKKLLSAGPSTRSLHANRQSNPYKSVSEPIVQTSTYQFDNTADLTDFMEDRLWGRGEDRTEYGRYGNPTVRTVEKRLAALENADDAILFSSGMAAITTVLLAFLPGGSNIVLTEDCYRRTRQFCNTFLKRLGITSTVVPMGDYEALDAAIQPNTRLILSESPTNPYLRVLDLEKLVAIAKEHKVKTFIDATFATPLNIRPIDFGVDLVIHSGTKYLGGHNDILSGVVAGEASLINGLRSTLGILGAIADPSNAALLLRGVKTLGLRIERQNASGLAVAEFLQSHPNVSQVWYPGLSSHPDYKIAVEQMSGFGGVVSFTIDGDLQDTSQFIDALNIPLIAASLGGVETLVEQVALMSFYELSTEERLEVGVSDNLVRLSLGIEDTQDLIDDLAQALEQVA